MHNVYHPSSFLDLTDGDSHYYMSEKLKIFRNLDIILYILYIYVSG